jgi:hypothetical protein
VFGTARDAGAPPPRAAPVAQRGAPETAGDARRTATLLADARRAAPAGASNSGLPVDLGVLTEELWGTLAGAVDRQTIRQVLAEVEPKYRDARIPTFVPIFVRRDALAILRKRA